MQRILVQERSNLESTALEHGYDFGSDGVPYWDETAYYRFTLAQIEGDIEKSALEIDAMCFQVLERLLWDETVYRKLGIPEIYWDYVAKSWKNREIDLYGRMDFSYDGASNPKLLEYNADTPTTLYESAVFQWIWLEEAIAEGLIHKDCDQFAELHEYLVQAFTAIDDGGIIHFGCLIDAEDDKDTVDYLEECAQEAGVTTQFLAMRDIGVDEIGRFSDLEDRVIERFFKLYPWEWVMEEEFGKYLMNSGVHFLEPPWKAVLSNKGLLPLLWEMFEGHPNLLPAYFEDEDNANSLSGSYVRKPLLSRQGANIEIVEAGKAISRTGGLYGKGAYVRQAFHPLPDFDGKFPLVGCWMVAGRPAGLSIRESTTLITDCGAKFVPHVIQD